MNLFRVVLHLPSPWHSPNPGHWQRGELTLSTVLVNLFWLCTLYSQDFFHALWVYLEIFTIFYMITLLPLYSICSVRTWSGCPGLEPRFLDFYGGTTLSEQQELRTYLVLLLARALFLPSIRVRIEPLESWESVQSTFQPDNHPLLQAREPLLPAREPLLLAREPLLLAREPLLLARKTLLLARNTLLLARHIG